jgi:hypothetical protein
MIAQLKIIRDFLWWMLFIGLLVYCGKVNAQVLPEYSAFPKSSVGVQVSTQGIGVQGSWSFLQAFNARLGFNAVPGITVQYNGRDLKLSRTGVYAIADWQPLYGQDGLARKWFVSAGVAYYFSNAVYREGIGITPDYSVSMSKFRPYIGTGLGNIHVFNDISMRADFGFFIPTSAPVSTYENKANTITNGLKGLLPGMNAGLTFYYHF